MTDPYIPPSTPEQIQAVHRQRTRLPAGLSEAELAQGYAVPAAPEPKLEAD